MATLAALPFALLPPPEQSGWNLLNSEYLVDWECVELQQKRRLIF